MKTLLVTSRYWPHAVGGAERVVQTLATQLLNDGHEVVVLTTAHGTDERDREVAGVRVRAVPLRNLYDFSGSPHAGFLKPVWHAIDSNNLLMRPLVRTIIEQESPDVIHTHVITGFSPSVWRAARDCHLPVVHTLHDHYLLCARSTMAIDGVQCVSRHLSCRLLSIPRASATRDVDAVVGVSDFVLNRHREFGLFGTTRSYVIPNPCHLVGQHLTAARNASASTTLRIGYLGRLERNKGILLLLDAVRGLPEADWSLAIAGTGEEQFGGSVRARYSSDRIAFLGAVDPREFLAGIDLLVVPSLVEETFGLGIAEAFAMGVPVVASIRGALPEIVQDDRTGFLFDPATPGSLPSVLRRIVETRSRLPMMRSACLATAASFAPALVTNRYLAIYDAVCNASNSG